MVPSLEAGVDRLRQKAKQKNYSFAVVESNSENMVVVVIDSTPAMLVTPPERYRDSTIFPMKVNTSRWAWAIKEGFDSKEIFDLESVGKEIFTFVNEKSILEYLNLD
jgi:hypothetical protein